MTHAQYARTHVLDMQAFDALPAPVRAELRRTGEDTRSYLRRTRRDDFDW